ncbi:carbon-nitrogen hydrolase family protein [Nocardioidaceae bacterium]|nr:carbon-nitrogen hydrolase family protein [Nocardioidaceae bacterium]
MPEHPADLRVTVLQWAASTDPGANRSRLAELQALAADTDLIVLPEVFARDFGSPGDPLGPHAEPLDGPFVTALRELAAAGEVTIVAGMLEVSEDPERPWNTLACVHPDGSLDTYRKVHLYDSFGFKESEVMGAGEVLPSVVDVRGVPVGLMTCYDLRFPEMGRALVDAGAEVLVAPAAWVAGEHKPHHWRTLLTARAIEDVCWVVGAGQPEPRYTGRSLVVDPWGRAVAEAGPDEEVLRAVISPGAVAEARRTNPSLANRRMGWMALTQA